MNNTAKVLFVIDGVAERKTSCMLNDYLVPRLNFACFVQVVANYVLAFDLVTNCDFDAIVLPRTNVIDHFSTDDFVDVMSNLADFTGSLIHTVDHDSASHVHGRTVRSSKSGSGGYVIDDILAAISFAVKEASLPEEHHNVRLGVHQVVSDRNAGFPKSNKRPRRDFAGTSRFPVASEQQNQQRPHKLSKHEQDHPKFSYRAEEAAYLHYCQWYQLQQWQLFAQAQGLPRTPAVVSDSSATSLNPIIDTSTILAVPTIPSPLPILHYHHPYYHNTQHHNHHTPQPIHLDHQFPVIHPYLPLPILGDPHPHHYYLELLQQPLYNHRDHHDNYDGHLYSKEVHGEQGRSVRADSCSTHNTHNTTTSTTSTSATTMDSAALLTTEEVAIPHTAGLLADACSDGLSTMSMEDRDELLEFMNEDLWNF